ncbi:patatin-like phospholipase family protein [Rhizobium rhizogenes]|uniref:patatin-like phospholipase family protein n=1 Tax=Rhizobium rhizogenes TaxID=359 RepID=UPI001F2661EB|nr:patatin-like phospholipase family protein [Rhizobium rhizogenes]
MKYDPRLMRASSLFAVMIVCAGCVTTERTAYTAQDSAVAELPGFERMRVYADVVSPDKANPAWTIQTGNSRQNALVISGGGAGGAFSVGVLSAWTKQGTRPDFDIVTGVSTGALIAPYAFLGSAYDQKLVQLYTSGIAKTLVKPRWLPSGLLGQSLLKQEPLRDLVERCITPNVMDAVAAENAKGRRLFIMTSNLDAQRAVIWNMGAIAASGQPGALQLFRQVLLASASIPGVYPAVLIKVRSGNRTIEEMHSDGGSASQFLAIPEAAMTSPNAIRPPKGVKMNMYVLVNNALMPEFSLTQDSTFPVISRAYSLLIKSQTRSSLVALYGYAKHVGIDVHLASIDAEVKYDMSDPFDTNYMRAVFNLGLEEMTRGVLWKAAPIFPAIQSAPASTANQSVQKTTMEGLKGHAFAHKI